MPPCLDEIREVRLYGRHVGEIRRLGLTELEFEYAPGYVHAPDAVPLSTSLPLDAPVPSTEAATRWFEGLLPEGKRRTQLARIVGTTDVDVWSLLDAACCIPRYFVADFSVYSWSSTARFVTLTRHRRRAGRARLARGHGDATVIAIVTVVVVGMDWSARPTLGNARGR